MQGIKIIDSVTTEKDGKKEVVGPHIDESGKIEKDVLENLLPLNDTNIITSKTPSAISIP